MKEVKDKIAAISRVFDIRDVLSLKIDLNYIAKYYRINKIPYSIFHTNSDLMYMGISRDGVYKFEDLQEHAKLVDKYVKQLNATNVLELATGRGGNSFYLAQQNPNTSFFGLDLSDGQLYYSRKKSKKVNNYFPEKGDYHDLGRYADNMFDVVFEVEALCYSMDKKKVLREVWRVLKPGGVFILFDGYRYKSNLDDMEDSACSLVEKGMALEKFELYSSFANTALLNNFSIIKEEDVSKYVIPTMERFERQAGKFFKYPYAAKLISRIFPKEFTYNSISGYLMPVTMREQLLVYMITILKKEQNSSHNPIPPLLQ